MTMISIFEVIMCVKKIENFIFLQPSIIFNFLFNFEHFKF